jgi:hypothetical protein
MAMAAYQSHFATSHKCRWNLRLPWRIGDREMTIFRDINLTCSIELVLFQTGYYHGVLANTARFHSVFFSWCNITCIVPQSLNFKKSDDKRILLSVKHMGDWCGRRCGFFWSSEVLNEKVCFYLLLESLFRYLDFAYRFSNCYFYRLFILVSFLIGTYLEKGQVNRRTLRDL